MSPDLPPVDTDGFWRDGYTLVRSVFSAGEIAELRERALRHRGWKGDLLTNPELGDVVTSERLVALAEQLLGGPPVYFGFSSVTYGVKGRGYHKDNADRHDPSAPDWQGRYTLVRLGVYLQDHHDYSGGLNVLHRSHLRCDHLGGRTVYLDSRPGDVVAWNLRTSHSANGVLLRWPRSLSVAPQTVKRIPTFLLRPEGADRVAVFVTYALDDSHLARYLRYLASRKFMIDLWSSSPLTDEIRARANGTRLTIKDAWAEVSGWSDLGANVDHADIPY